MENEKIKVWLPIILIGIFFAVLVIFHSDIIDKISSTQQKYLTAEQHKAAENYLRKEYNYALNGESYSYTFLEFGSTSCKECKQMEQVMEEVERRFTGKVNVVFVDVMKPSNELLINHFGVATVPYQIILDRSAKERFRHSAYISADDLSLHLVDIGQR